MPASSSTTASIAARCCAPLLATVVSSAPMRMCRARPSKKREIAEPPEDAAQARSVRFGWKADATDQRRAPRIRHSSATAKTGTRTFAKHPAGLPRLLFVRWSWKYPDEEVNVGAGAGALAGGVSGLIKRHGVSDEDARYYEDSITRGAVFVSVETGRHMKPERVHEIMFRHGGHNASRPSAATAH